jgi:two-component system sensor histidine kinase SenX3
VSGGEVAGIAAGSAFVGAVAAAAIAARRARPLRRALQSSQSRAEAARGAVDIRESALAAMPLGVVVFDSAGDIAYGNDAARMLAARRFDRASELSPETLRAAVIRAMQDRAEEDVEFDSADRLVHAMAIPTDAGGAVLLLRNVTGERRTERIRRDFVTNASHELKTPVSSIVALTEALRDAAGTDRDATERFLALLEQDSRRLTRLVTALLDLSRLETETGAREPVRLDNVVEEEVARLQSRADADGLGIVLDDSDQAVVMGSEGDLGLLVNNLLDNAIHYSPDGGQIRVSVRVEDGSATLTVADTGIGIASRDLDRIFERFYRADPARSRETGGTGLGLSIVKHVAETHGGDVRVQSVLGAGSTFTVRLPLAEPAPA